VASTPLPWLRLCLHPPAQRHHVARRAASPSLCPARLASRRARASLSIVALLFLTGHRPPPELCVHPSAQPTQRSPRAPPHPASAPPVSPLAAPAQPCIAVDAARRSLPIGRISIIDRFEARLPIPPYLGTCSVKVPIGVGFLCRGRIIARLDEESYPP
jgi:hypothetical protein